MITTTQHKIINDDSRHLHGVESASVHLVITSPPYPMIEMWDQQFSLLNSEISQTLADANAHQSFDMMHDILDEVWAEVARVLVPGGFACINIGDATRTIAGRFRIYPNHSRIIRTCSALGLDMLPGIIWRKTTNSPNKFMGSGMLPAGAYMTLEHEHILIFRKPGIRPFVSTTDKQKRRESAYFWEERNQWFSDIWDLKGVMQKISGEYGRPRSAAYPFELPYRLINMYSLIGDTVLDPFLGMGTTSVAAIVAARNSIGFEIETSLLPAIDIAISQCPEINKTHNNNRLFNHVLFLNECKRRGKIPKYQNINYKFAVVTKQEENLTLMRCDKVCTIKKNMLYTASHSLFTPLFSTHANQEENEIFHCKNIE